ncbi:MAG: AAA family ATPase [Defluviitaleaceae bacterium]|nr:AAA family ATPase [Defluviitaleaceae bacterium]
MNLQPLAGQIYTVAVNEANLNSHEYITPEHFLYAVLMFEDGRDIIKQSGGVISAISLDLQAYFNEHIERTTGEPPIESASFVRMLEAALAQAMGSQKDEVSLGDILVSMFNLPQSFAVHIMRSNGVDRLEMMKYISHGMKKQVGGGAQKSSDKGDGFLEKYTTNLVERAKDGLLDPLVGRVDVLSDIELLLCRRLKNNPVLVGDAGVGKSAIVEGLAQKIAKGDVPKPLRNVNIYHMDMGIVIAGTKYRGDFEDRLIGILEEAAAEDGAIMYIDEIHSVVGAGAVSGGTLDATSIIKPYLAKGQLKFIGATTFEEYKKYFEKDSALTRRFHKIDILEPSADEALEILEGLVGKYEGHHGVKYAPEALEMAVKLSQKYLHDLRLPDKAIDIIDQCGARCANEELGIRNEELMVLVSDVERVVAKMARIPETSVSADEKRSLGLLSERLGERVFGQDGAISAVTGAMKAARMGLNDPEKPVASLLFVGPTGVGKTEVARTLADVLNIRLVRFDMSEYQESHAVARLIGSPPGYVGYDEGGLLVDAVRKTPHCVLLLDEIEKAHANIMNVLLQVMDYGKLTDNSGKKADFRNVIIIMTSNAGAREADRDVIGFGGMRNSDAMGREVSRVFAPEFRNRLNQIVYFNAINEDMASKIARKAIGVLQSRLVERNVEITASDEVIDFIARKGFSAAYGAREIIRIVEGPVKEKIVEALLGDEAADKKHVLELILKGEEIFVI